MNCFVSEGHGRDREAVAVCHDCGAAVCSEHAVVRDHQLTGTITRIIVVEPPARVLRCEVCAAAHDAASGDTRVNRRLHRHVAVKS